MQLAQSHERRPPIDAVLPTEVDRQLGRLVELLWQLHRADLAREQTGAFECDQSPALDLKQLLEQRLDPRALVDRDRHDGQVL